MTLDACADLVQRGDPHRFRAVLAAPRPAREVLLSLYAFNLEVTRAPWAASEPLIAEMRLQWWRDMLGEVMEGRPVRRHEVATPLAEALTPDTASALDDLIDARRWDAWREPHDDTAALLSYLDRTAGTLTGVAATLLGAADPAPARAAGQAAGFARYAIAVPKLIAAGRQPLPDDVDLAELALSLRPNLDARLPKPARPALLETVGAGPILGQIARDPSAVTDARLREPHAGVAARLFWRSLTG